MSVLWRRTLVKHVTRKESTHSNIVTNMYNNSNDVESELCGKESDTT